MKSSMIPPIVSVARGEGLNDRRLYALLLVTVFVIAAISQLPAASAISDYTVVSHTMCKNVTTQGVCTKEAHAFDTSDARAYLHFRVKIGETGTIAASNKWYYQSGSEEAGGDWDVTSVKEGDTWTFWWWMYIKDDKASLRGFWSADVSIEGKVAFTEKFTIGPYYEVRVDMKGLADTVSIPIRVDGEGYGEVKGGETRKLGFAPGTSHTLSITKKEVSGATGVRYITQEDAWEFSAEGSHSFSFAEQCQLNVEVDPAGTVSVSGAGWYDKGATANLGEMPAVVALAEGTQFARKSILVDGQEVSTAPTSITMDKPHSVKVQYQKQHFLKVMSDHGSPKGEGWYNEGTEAKFSVTSPQPEPGFLGQLGAKMVFQAWNGDSTDKSASATIRMDAPKTVRAVWKADETQAYIILGGIGAAIAVVIVMVLLFTRRKGAAPARAPVPVGPFVPPPPPPAQVMTPAPTVTPRPAPIVAPPSAARAPPPDMKFCIHCGQPIPQAAKFCTNIKCGMPQQ